MESQCSVHVMLALHGIRQLKDQFSSPHAPISPDLLMASHVLGHARYSHYGYHHAEATWNTVLDHHISLGRGLSYGKNIFWASEISWPFLGKEKAYKNNVLRKR